MTATLRNHVQLAHLAITLLQDAAYITTTPTALASSLLPNAFKDATACTCVLSVTSWGECSESTGFNNDCACVALRIAICDILVCCAQVSHHAPHTTPREAAALHQGQTPRHRQLSLCCLNNLHTHMLIRAPQDRCALYSAGQRQSLVKQVRPRKISRANVARVPLHSRLMQQP